MQTYSPASFLLLLEMFSCFKWDKLIPDFSHLTLGSGKPEASQVKNRGVDVLTVILYGTSVNWTGTRQEERNNHNIRVRFGSKLLYGGGEDRHNTSTSLPGSISSLFGAAMIYRMGSFIDKMLIGKKRFPVLDYNSKGLKNDKRCFYPPFMLSLTVASAPSPASLCGTHLYSPLCWDRLTLLRVYSLLLFSLRRLPLK